MRAKDGKPPFRRLFGPRWTDTESPKTDRRLRFGWLMIFVGAPFFYVYTVYFWRQGLPLAAGSTLFAAVSITVVFVIFLTRSGRNMSDRTFKAIVVFCVLLPLFLHDFDVVWMKGRLEFLPWLFLYPPLAFYLLGERGGFVLLVSLGVLPLAGILLRFLPPLVDIRPVQPLSIMAQLTVAMLIVTFISWISERTIRQTFDQFTRSREQLRAARDELEIRVAERTSELNEANARLSRELREREQLEERFVQAQKMESIGILAGGIAHDFNNILQMISGYTSLLLAEKAETDPDHEALTIVMSGAERATQLARKLLLFSRHEQGDLRPLDLNAHVLEMKTLLSSTIPRMIAIETHLDGKLSKVDADPGQIQQVIMNLAVNARDAMPEGGRLTFETRNVVLDSEFAERNPGARAGEHVHLSVSDTGTGMDEETMRHIYDPFFTTKEIGKGTGLGLSVVFGIIAGHDGFISCRSSPGAGTTFDIYLPVSTRLTDEPGGATADSLEIPGGAERILCVDDDPHILKLESRILSRKGYTVVTAPSGEEAIPCYVASTPALVILDMDMPGMGGYQCMQKLLTIDPEAVVIIASGYSRSHLPEDLRNRGAAAFLPKPFTAHELLRHVREALDRARSP